MAVAHFVPNLDDPEVRFDELIAEPRELVVLEEGTCTYRAGERFAQAAFEEAPCLVEARNFTEAIELAKSAGRILLLPHLANPAVVEVTYSNEWRDLPRFAFTYTNPPLHLARTSTDVSVLEAAGICAALKTIHRLTVPEEDGFSDWLWVDSTQQAAAVCAEGNAELCITNQHGLERYELTSVRELKKMVPLWLPYEWLPAVA